MGLVHCLVLMVMLRPPLKIKCNKQSAWRPLSPLTPGLWVIYHRVACKTAMMREVSGAQVGVYEYIQAQILTATLWLWPGLTTTEQEKLLTSVCLHAHWEKIAKASLQKGGMICGQLLFDRLSDMAFEFLPLVSNSFKMF